MKIATALISAALMSGCVMHAKRVSDPGAEQVALLQQAPEARPFRSLGVVEYKFYRPGMDRPTVYDVWPELSAEVRAIGGNACVIRGEDVGWLSQRTLTVTCEVLAVDES